jgi:hypothetical protein
MPKYSLSLNNDSYLPYSEPFFYTIKNTKGIMTHANVSWLSDLTEASTFRDAFIGYDPKDKRPTIVQALIN